MYIYDTMHITHIFMEVNKMIDKVKTNLATGLNRVKWIASFVADRTKSEASLARLLYESNKLEHKMDGIYKDIGKRVMELKEKAGSEERDVFKDFQVQQSFDEVKKLKETLDDYKAKARDLNKLPE